MNNQQRKKGKERKKNVKKDINKEERKIQSTKQVRRSNFLWFACFGLRASILNNTRSK